MAALPTVAASAHSRALGIITLISWLLTASIGAYMFGKLAASGGSTNGLHLPCVAGSPEDSFIRRKPLSPDTHRHQTWFTFHRENYETHTTVSTRVWVRGIDIGSVRYAHIISFHLRRSKRHGLFGTLVIASSEKRSERLFVAVFPGVERR